ncbi:MAG: hypothetical protein Q9214_004769 [Letrouitia sp. 1 TL-2023]
MNDEVRSLRLDELPCSLFLGNRQDAGRYEYMAIGSEISLPDSVYLGFDPSYKDLDCRIKTRNYNGNFNIARTEVTATGWDNAFFAAQRTALPKKPTLSRSLKASPGSGGLPAAFSQPRSTPGPGQIEIPSTKSSDSGRSPRREGNRPTLIADANPTPIGPIRNSKHIEAALGTFGPLQGPISATNLELSAFGSIRPLFYRSEVTATNVGGLLGPLPNLQSISQTRQPVHYRIQLTASGFSGLRDSPRTTDDLARAQISTSSDISRSKKTKNSHSISSAVQHNVDFIADFDPTARRHPQGMKYSGLMRPNANGAETPSSFAAARNSLQLTSNLLPALGLLGEESSVKAPPGKSPFQQFSVSKGSNDPIQMTPGNPNTHQSPTTVGQRATGLPLTAMPVAFGGQSQELVPISLSEQIHSETPSKKGPRASGLSEPNLGANPEELPVSASAEFPAVTGSGQIESLVPVNLSNMVADQVAPQAGQSNTIPLARGSENANPIPNQGSDISAFPEITVGGHREQLVPVGSSDADVGSHTIVAGSAPILVAGTPLSLGQSTLAVGPSLVPLRPLQSQARIGGTAIALNPTAIPIAGTILSLGGPAVTVDKTPVSLGRMGLAVGSSTLPIPNKRPNSVFAVGVETFFSGESSSTLEKGWRAQSTVASNLHNLGPLQFSIAGTTLSQGGPGITVSSTPISLGLNGLAVGKATLPIAAVSQANQSPLIVAGQVFTPNPTGFPIADTALSRGGPGIALSGTLISFGASRLVIGEATLPIAAASQTNQSPLIVAGQVFTPNPTGFPIADTALSQGGPGVTLSGTPVSLGPSGLVVGKTTLPLATEFRATQAPLKVGGQIFTPNPSRFPIAGTILSLGGPGITISQTPVSLGASGLLIGFSTLPLDISNSANFANTPSVFSIAGNVITEGGPPITISSTRISLGPSGLVVGTRIVPLSALAIPTATTMAPSGAIYSIGGTRITQGGPAITISGTRVSLGTKALVIGSSTIPLPSQDMVNETSTRSSTDTKRSFESSILPSSVTAIPTEPSASSLGRPIPPVVDNDRAGTGRMRSRRGPLYGLFAFSVVFCIT